MIAVGMGAYIEFKVIFCNTHTFQIGNHLIFESQSFGNTCTQRIAGITAIRIIIVFTGVDHTEFSIAFDENGIGIMV